MSTILLTGSPRYEDELTLTGQVLGTPNYMPPEQADPKRGETTAASDVYSLGAILYHLLAGCPPFLAETLTKTLRLVVESEAVSPRLLNPSVARDVETICLKCLEKDPQRRYPSAQELADELGRFLRNEPIRARPIGRPAKLMRWCRRKPALALSLGAAALLLLLVVIGSPVAIFRINAQRNLAEAARGRAETAERDTRQQLYAALLEQARGTVKSGELGQRVSALDGLRRAAAISNTVELRREVFAALALPDLRFKREILAGSDFTLVLLDPRLERVALCSGRGPVEIRSVSDHRLLTSLPASTSRPAYFGKWSANGQFLAIKRDYEAAGRRADVEIWEMGGVRPSSGVATSKPQPAPKSHDPSVPSPGSAPEDGRSLEPRRILLLRDVPTGLVSFHPHLPQIIAASRDGSAVVWNLEDGTSTTPFRFP